MKTCGCGCGAEVTKTYKPGHDARHKSQLIREAKTGEQWALDLLAEKGWTHFYEKSVNADNRRSLPRAVQRKIEIEDGVERAKKRMALLDGMKAAATELKKIDRYAGETKILVTADNYQQILDEGAVKYAKHHDREQADLARLAESEPHVSGDNPGSDEARPSVGRGKNKRRKR